jgi:uncharacterized protein YxeA
MGDIIFLMIMFILGIIIVIVSFGAFLIKKIRIPEKNLVVRIETLEDEIKKLTNDKK